MSTCLHVRVGPYPILLDADGVLEVLDLAGDDATMANCRDWRGMALPAVNARLVFGVPEVSLPAAHAGIVYSDGTDAAPILLEVDKVESLLQIDPDQLRPLPAASRQARQWFDGVWLDTASGHSRYHLRRDLALARLVQCCTLSGA
jgi:hypothetical protein